MSDERAVGAVMAAPSSWLPGLSKLALAVMTCILIIWEIEHRQTGSAVIPKHGGSSSGVTDDATTLHRSQPHDRSHLLADPRVQPILIPIFTMQRSGSTELLADLALSSPLPLNNAGESFTLLPLQSDPVPHWLRAAVPANSSAVFKVFSSAPREHIRSLLRERTICPVILERTNVTARFCSLLAAVGTGDWTGHHHHDNSGARRHPPCDPALVASASLAAAGGARSLAAFRQQQASWFEWITLALHHAGIPFLKLTFDTVISDRPRALDAVLRFCGLHSHHASPHHVHHAPAPVLRAGNLDPSFSVFGV